MSELRFTLRDLLFPPRCAVCGERQEAHTSGSEPLVLCATCRELWERETRLQCDDCFCEAYRCRCATPLMKKAGVTELLRLMPYGDGGKHRAARRIVSSLKTRHSARCFSFVAEELADEVRGALSSVRENAVITFLPRTRRAVRRYGYDQAEELARALAAEVELPFLPLLSRARDGKAQKALDRRARVANLRGAFSLSGEVGGRLVVLVDDVVTTGAGMAEAARLLLAAGARSVVGVAVAVTKKKQA